MNYVTYDVENIIYVGGKTIKDDCLNIARMILKCEELKPISLFTGIGISNHGFYKEYLAKPLLKDFKTSIDKYGGFEIRCTTENKPPEDTLKRIIKAFPNAKIVNEWHGSQSNVWEDWQDDNGIDEWDEGYVLDLEDDGIYEMDDEEDE